MSTIQQNVDPPATPVTPAMPYSESAQGFIDQLRAMREQIPKFTFPTTAVTTSALARVASVPQPFVELTAVAVKNSPALVRGGGADPEELRDLLTYAQSYPPLADELEALAAFVRHSVVSAKNKAGSDALTTFELAKRLAKRPETADLAPQSRICAVPWRRRVICRAQVEEDAEPRAGTVSHAGTRPGKQHIAG